MLLQRCPASDTVVRQGPGVLQLLTAKGEPGPLHVLPGPLVYVAPELLGGAVATEAEGESLAGLSLDEELHQIVALARGGCPSYHAGGGPDLAAGAGTPLALVRVRALSGHAGDAS